MFAKLLKYEWKATAKPLGLMSLGALGAGVLGSCLLRLLAENCDTKPVLEMVMGFVLMGLYLVLFAYLLGSHIFLLYRFYKNKFTDEGYLTFTLPVTSQQIILSAAVNIMIWQAITTVVYMVCYGAMLYFGLLQSSDEMMGTLTTMMDVLGNQFGIGGLIFALICGVITMAAGVLLAMTAITVGAVVAKKHKLLAALGLYYGGSMVLGLLMQIVLFVVMVFTIMIGGEPEPAGIMRIMCGTMAVTYGVTGFIGYSLMNRFINRKLNLT